MSDDSHALALANALAGRGWRRFGRFVLAALGSIPWVGGFMSASATLQADVEQGHVNKLQQEWLSEHADKLAQLEAALLQMLQRFDRFGDQADARTQDESYLSLVRYGFNVWDGAATEEKRQLVQQLLTNAAGTTLCSDDVVRLFLDWIRRFHEMHFAVIRAIYANRGITRGAIWDRIRGTRPRDDSADADLFKLLIFELSTARIVRQWRETTSTGEFVRQRSRRPQGSTLKSAFDDVEPYDLTELGEQFVHYAIEDAAPRLAGESEGVG